MKYKERFELTKEVSADLSKLTIYELSHIAGIVEGIIIGKSLKNSA